MVLAEGVEPPIDAYKATVIPFNYASVGCGDEDRTRLDQLMRLMNIHCSTPLYGDPYRIRTCDLG